MKIKQKIRKSSCALVAFGLLIHSLTSWVIPPILINDSQNKAILEKINTVDLAQNTYQQIKTRVDKYITKVGVDPNWMTSRLAMSWENHY